MTTETTTHVHDLGVSIHGADIPVEVMDDLVQRLMVGLQATLEALPKKYQGLVQTQLYATVSYDGRRDCTLDEPGHPVR